MLALAVQTSVPSRTARVSSFIREQLKNKAVRAALAALLGLMLGSLCQYAPDGFHAPCRAAAKLCRVIMAGSST